MSETATIPKDRKEERRLYYLANKERIGELRKQRYQNNKEKELARNRDWAVLNKERTTEYQKRWKQENRLRLNAMQQQRRLKNKDAINRRSRERYPLVAESRRIAGKKWRMKNPDKVKELNTKYRVNNRASYNERKRLEYHRLTPEQKISRRNTLKAWHKRNPGYMVAHRDLRKRAMVKTGVRLDLITKWIARVKSHPFIDCYYCKRLCHTLDIHIDHIVPLSRGGAHAISNLCAACPSCNLSKQDLLIPEWRRIPIPVLNL